MPQSIARRGRVSAVPTRGRGSAARFPVRELIDALLARDDVGAYAVAERMLLRTRSRVAVFADLLHAALAEIGNLWYTGRVSYADEVEAAAGVRRIAGGLPATPAARRVAPGSCCVLAVPYGDPHDVGLLMVTLALQDHGWSTELMGPLDGLGDVAEAVVTRRPRLFGLSAACLPALQEVEGAVATIKRAGVPVLVGGVGFNRRPDLWRAVGAGGLGTDVRVGVVLAHRLAGR